MALEHRFVGLPKWCDAFDKLRDFDSVSALERGLQGGKFALKGDRAEGAAATGEAVDQHRRITGDRLLA